MKIVKIRDILRGKTKKQAKKQILWLSLRIFVINYQYPPPQKKKNGNLVDFAFPQGENERKWKKKKKREKYLELTREEQQLNNPFKNLLRNIRLVGCLDFMAYQPL